MAPHLSARMEIRGIVGTDGQPPPKSCAQCQLVVGWEADTDDVEDPWMLETEWWIGSDGSFLHSRQCWLKHEGYAWSADDGAYVRPGEDLPAGPDYPAAGSGVHSLR
jgi:hypothetical protein